MKKAHSVKREGGGPKKEPLKKKSFCVKNKVRGGSKGIEAMRTNTPGKSIGLPFLSEVRLGSSIGSYCSIRLLVSYQAVAMKSELL